MLYDYLKRGMFCRGKVLHFLCMMKHHETFFWKMTLKLLNFKQSKCNTAELFHRNTSVHTTRETYPTEHSLFKVCLAG